MSNSVFIGDNQKATPEQIVIEQIEILKANPLDQLAFDIAIDAITELEFLKSESYMKALSNASNVPLKRLNPQINLAKTKKESLSHDAISEKFIDEVSKGSGVDPVSCVGSLWTYSTEEGIWTANSKDELSVKIPKAIKNQKNCVRVSDYSAIANHCLNRNHDKSFLEEAPKGITTPDGFYTVEGDEVVCKPISPENRSTFTVNQSPSETAEPTEFLGMLKDAFGSTYEDQMPVLRMGLGLALFGLLPDEHRALFLYGASRSGKSTIVRVMSELFPSHAKASVSPFDLDKEYSRASLAGKAVNLVPELRKGALIPDDVFKMVLGGDEMSARNPYEKGFNFKSRASCIFNGNYLPHSKDTGRSFFDRWLVVEFLHAKKAEDLDVRLTDRIIENELGSVLSWCIEGVKDYLENGLRLSKQHRIVMDKWQGNACSVSSWLDDNSEDSGVIVNHDAKKVTCIKTGAAYKAYQNWCRDSGNFALKKNNFKDRMLDLGHSDSKSNGGRVYSGLVGLASSPIYQGDH